MKKYILVTQELALTAISTYVNLNFIIVSQLLQAVSSVTDSNLHKTNYKSLSL